jgi:hypothetical protein
MCTKENKKTLGGTQVNKTNVGGTHVNNRKHNYGWNPVKCANRLIHFGLYYTKVN